VNANNSVHGIPRCETEDLPLFSGEILRDEGIKKVMSNNESWMEQALRFAELFVSRREGEDFTGEDIRFCLENLGVDPPRHPNAYGALINCLVRRKVIVPTGRYVNPKDRSSHARKIQVYEAV
jgi:hypothetical protein